MDNYQAAGCLGKVGFDTVVLAQKAAARKPGWRPYKCETCRKWHVGNPKFKNTFKRPAPSRRW